MVGSAGTGKTTFSVSASEHAGDVIPCTSPVNCTDVALIQGDTEGVLGASRAGFNVPYVYDLSHIDTWDKYTNELGLALKDLQPALGNAIRVVIIDLAHPNRLVAEHISPSVQKDWGLVAKEGLRLFKAFYSMRGVTVIGNAQLKASASPGETQQAADAANARAVGGERSTFTMDLYKGLGAIWTEHASLTIARECKRKRVGQEYVTQFFSHTQSGAKYEAKSRFRDVLKPVEDGNITLRALLARAL